MTMKLCVHYHQKIMKTGICAIVGFLLLQQVTAQLFCSAICTYSFNGGGYSPFCTGPLETDCQACDPIFFSWDGTKCVAPNTTYTLQQKDFYPVGILDGSWAATNPAGVTVNTFNTSYTVIDFIGNTAISKAFSLATAHSSIRLRMFILIVGNPSYDFKIIVDGNTSNPYPVDNSSRLYLSNTSSDSYIYSSVDIPHSNASVSLTFIVQNLQGTASSFGIKELMIFTKNCPVECTGCDQTGACTGCALIGTTQYMLAAGKCLTYCPAGYFVDTMIGVCGKCDAMCLTCSTTSVNCTSCQQVNPAWAYLWTNICTSACPTGYYASGYVCNQCFQGCLTCTGPGKDNCQSCMTVGTLPYYLVSGSTSCEMACPPGQYFDQFFPNTCNMCDPYCLTCDSSSLNCRSCVTNGTYESYLFSSNNSCFPSCPNNFFQDSSTHTCYCNGSYYISEAGFCVRCSLACKSCTYSSADNCTVCSDNYYLLVNSTSCRSICPSGQYPDSSGGKCAPCDRSCFTCAGSSSYCTGCNADTYLLGSVCASDCPAGYMKGTAPNKCVQCEVNMVSFNGSCLSVCPPGYAPVNLACYSQNILNKKKANFTTELSIINSGSRLQIELKFPVPIAKNSSLVQRNIKVYVKQFVSRRMLETTETLSIKNIIIDDTYTNVKILTEIPKGIGNYETSVLSVDFSQDQLFSSDGLAYKSYSGVFPLNTPSFVNELYKNYYKSSLSGIGIFFTVVGLLLLVLSYWNSYSLYPCIQFFMMLQCIYVFSFTAYPVQFSLSSFLTGFSTIHYQFLPNIFNIAAGDYLQDAFKVYQFKTLDMNFLRLVSPVVLLLCVVGIIMGYMYVWDKKGLRRVLKWMAKVVVYAVSMNLLFDGFSSLVGLFVNYDNTRALFVISQMLGLVVLGLLGWYYSKTKNLLKKKLFMIGDFIFCFTVPLFPVSTSIFLILTAVIQITLIMYYWKKVMKKTDKRNWIQLIERIINVIILNVIVMVQNSMAVIMITSILLFACLLMTLYLYYIGIKKKYTQKRVQQKSSTSTQLRQPLPVSNSSSVLPSNNTLITEQDDKPPVIEVAKVPTIIYQYELEESPAKHKSDELSQIKPQSREKMVRMQRKLKSLKNRLQPEDYDDHFHEQQKAATSRDIEDLDDSIYRPEFGSVYQPTPKRKVRFQMLRNKNSERSKQEQSQV